MNPIDKFLNDITMYRLTMFGLGILALVTIVCAFFGWLPFTALDLLLSLVALLFGTYASNSLFALFTKAAPTPESAYITALILFFICTPLQSANDAVLLILAAVIAMASKYIIVWNKKHIFNPAAFAALAFTLAGSGLASWWIATPILLPFVLIIGLLVVRKLRRFDLFFTFIAVATVVFLVRSYLGGTPPVTAFLQFLTSWPLFFFGTFMLTEPQTAPPQKSDRFIYGGIIGLLFSLAFNFGPLTATPELALIVGNIYSYAVSMRRRISLRFHSVTKLSREIYEFAFDPNVQLKFQAGQYVEWTLSHKPTDKRGIRRFFTVASAPEDPVVRLGVRVPPESSHFKDALLAFSEPPKKGGISIEPIVSITGLAGEFTLPQDPTQRMAMIAGGIGITPFMSMFRHLAMRHERRDMVLLYAAPTPADFAYNDEIEKIKDSIGLTVIYLPTDFTELSDWEGPSGNVTNVLIQKEIKDFKVRHWYLSGPQAMVENYSWLVRSMGVAKKDIKTDYFPGF